MKPRNPWTLVLASFGSGILFAFGLAVSGMTEPAKVIGFLDVAGGAWDPSLALVMVGAVAVNGLGWLVVKKRSRPVLADVFHLPTKKDIDARLVGGAALFGLGWGLGGFCPGPGVVALASGAAPAFAFVAAMLVGMKLVAWTDRWLQRKGEIAEPVAE